jgi:hypothetical protein
MQWQWKFVVSQLYLLRFNAGLRGNCIDVTALHGRNTGLLYQPFYALRGSLSNPANSPYLSRWTPISLCGDCLRFDWISMGRFNCLCRTVNVQKNNLLDLLLLVYNNHNLPLRKLLLLKPQKINTHCLRELHRTKMILWYYHFINCFFIPIYLLKRESS